jgi:hypothetical protein
VLEWVKMISKDEEKAFYEIMGGLVDEAEKIERKVDGQEKAKLIILIVAVVVGLVILISGAVLSSMIVGMLGFVIMFASGYMLSKIINI